MRLAPFAPVISRLGILALSSLLLLLAPRAVSARGVPEIGLWLVAARLALGLTLLLAVPGELLLALEARVRRGRILATCLLLGGLLPLLWPVVSYLAGGDGLRARGIPAPLTQAVALLLLEATAAAVWTYRYWARARAWDILLGLLFLSGLLFCALLVRRAQLELSACLELCALVLCVLLLHAAWFRRPAWLLRLGLVGLVTTGGLSLAGFAQPEALARGRRLALLTEATFGWFAAWLSPAPAVAGLPARSPALCARVLAPPSLPAVDLLPEQRRNVIFISIDSVRADAVRRLRPDGTLAMPAVAQFMDESRAARPAHAAYPATLMSLASALTGATPTDLVLAPDAYPTLFQLTRSHFDHVQVILPASRYFARPEVSTRLLAGAESWSEGGAVRQTRFAIDLLQTLRAEGKSHFVWLHYFDPHEPYDIHPPHEFGASDPQRYLSELAYVDDIIAPLLELLRSEGWYEDSLIALFSDHGESFGEHDHRYHHHLLYSWLLSVPFALHAPGLSPGLFEGPVQLTDLTPTVLQFMGVTPTRALRGLPLLASDPPPDRALFSEEIPLNSSLLQSLRERPLTSEAQVFARMHDIEHGLGYVSKLAVTRGGYQLVQHRDSQAAELYDVTHDLCAEHDLADREPRRTAALTAALARWRSDALLRALCEVARAPAAP